MSLRIQCSAHSGRIYAGHANKGSNAFPDGTVDVTYDALKAVVQYVGEGKNAAMLVGDDLFVIEVRRVIVQKGAA